MTAPAPIVSSGFLAIAVAAVTVLAGLAFAALAGVAIIQAWTTSAGGTPFGEGFTYFETGLAGLVGGVVATAFGVSLPDQKIAGLTRVATAGTSAKQWVGAAYVVIYFVVGIAAALTWVAHDDVSQVVKNLGSTFGGMVIPIVAGYFAQR